jgi:hypothetical protein
VDIFITKNDFYTLMDNVIVESTLHKYGATNITHATMMAAPEKT